MPIWMWPLLFAAGFGAGFVDAIAGGGGLITVPVLLGTGLAPADALATNKLQATFGSGSAAWHYRHARLVSLREAWTGVLATAVGAVIGVVAVTWLHPGLLRKIIPFLLLGAAIIVWRRPSLGASERPSRLGRTPFQLGAGLILGFYDGFFGPGTGTFWTLAFVMVLGFELLRATAWTKWMNFTSNLVSLAAFALAARIDWRIGALMGIGQWLGARLGAKVALKGGARFIRPVFLVVVLVATGKLFVDGWIRTDRGSDSGSTRVHAAACLVALARSTPAGPRGVEQAGTSLEALGTNAFPAFGQALLGGHPHRRWMFDAWRRLPEPLRRWITEPVPDERLRETAMNLVRTWPEEKRAALAREVAPRLLAAARDRRTRDRVGLVSGPLRELHPDADLVMPVLRGLLREPSSELREATLFMLIDYGRAASPLVPELTDTLADTNRQVLSFAVHLLGRLGTNARPAVPRLEAFLGAGFDDAAVAQSLWMIDRQTNTALRYLTNAIEDRSGNSAYTLGLMGPAGRPALPHLLAALESEVGNVRMNSARAVWKIAPEHLPEAIAAILRPLTNGFDAPPSSMDTHGAAWYAASVLRELGTNAAPARWALERGATSRQSDIARECRLALEALGPPSSP